MRHNVWLKVTTDKYELPVAVADSAAELASLVGVKECNIYSSMSHVKNGTYNSTPYRKVVITDE